MSNAALVGGGGVRAARGFHHGLLAGWIAWVVLAGCNRSVPGPTAGEAPQHGAAVRVPEVLERPAASPPRSGPCPTGMLLLEPSASDGLHPFCLGEIEVTVAEFRRCMEAGACDAIDPELMDPPEKATLLGDDDQMPINFIGGDEATQYCAFVGGRLPTEAEWKWAALSGKDQTFPWGDRLEFDKEYYCGAWIRPGQKFTDAIPCKARQYPTDRTKQGIYDLMGSLDELVDKDAEDKFGYAHSPAVKGTSPGPSREGYEASKRIHTFRGWGWMYNAELGVRCASTPTPR